MIILDSVNNIIRLKTITKLIKAIFMLVICVCTRNCFKLAHFIPCMSYRKVGIDVNSSNLLLELFIRDVHVQQLKPL